MMSQIVYSCLGALLAIGILALVFGTKTWVEKLIRDRNENMRDLRSKLDGLQRRLDRVMETVEGVSERLEDSEKREEGGTRTE